MAKLFVLYNVEIINHEPTIYIFPSLFSLAAPIIFNGIEISKSSAITTNNQSKITTEKGPVMLLYELFSDITFNCTQTCGPQHAKFKTLVTVNGSQQFEGTGEFIYL